MEQLIPARGVRQIPDFGFSNAYLVELDGQGMALIDTGTPGRTQKVLDYVASIGRKPGDVT
jgi:glyoxylase-like metal-dependent hydrolase (beta-lactamase superfamily II)